MCISLIISKLEYPQTNKLNWPMHNIKSNFDKILQTIQSLELSIINESGNIQKPGIPSLFTDLEGS